MSLPRSDDSIDALFREALAPMLSATPPRSVWRSVRRAVPAMQAGRQIEEKPAPVSGVALVWRLLWRTVDRRDGLSWVRATHMGYPPLANALLRIDLGRDMHPFAGLLMQRVLDLHLAS
jgi:hypothetical protein